MIRTLVIPNITWGGSNKKNLLQDSYIEFLYKFMLGMKSVRQDIFWYILLPKYKGKYSKQTSDAKKRLSFPHTHYIDIEVPRMPMNRIHFDVNELHKKIKCREYGIDLIFNHQPELNNQYKVFFEQMKNFMPPIIGYSHFFEFERVGWHGSFSHGITGILGMEVCYLNTSSQKHLVLDEAQKTFSLEVQNQLDKKLKVFPPMIVPRNVKPPKDGMYNKTIVWNHRTDSTKSFNDFQSVIWDLRKERQDFRVWIPLMDKGHPMSKVDYVDIGNNATKRKYFDGLRKCCVGVNGEQSYGGWSIATTDGNMCGVPYIQYDADYYKELNEGADFYKDKKGLIELLHKYLNSPSYRNKMAEQTIENLIVNHNIEKKIKSVSKKIDSVLKKTKVKNTPKSDRLIQIIKEEGKITQSKLLSSKFGNVGGQLKFDGYRKKILQEDKISEVQLSDKKGVRGGKRYEWRSVYKYDGVSKKVSIPLMMTNKMRLELRALGYSDKDIKSFTPKDAHDVIDMGKRK